MLSFNGVVQCTIDFTGHLLHARTDRDVYVSDAWHAASDVTLSLHRVDWLTCCKEYISWYRKSRQKWLRKIYDDNNIFMTNVDNSDTTYTNKHDNTEYNVRDEWEH